MEDSSAKWAEFENRLMKVWKHRHKLARRQGIDCFRVFDNDLPSFPFVIEVYGDKLYVAEYHRHHMMTEQEHEDWLDECLEVIAKITEVPAANIFLKERRRMSHKSQGRQYEKLGLSEEFFPVTENGLQFLVNLSDYLDSGLFLDHRITRKMVGDASGGKRVLNLFAYTGSFSVYAASGGASEVVSVDLSNTYLSWAENNFRINGLENPQKYRFVRADVKAYLKTLAPGSFDITVIDPPTFSNSKSMKDVLDVQRDHVEMLNDVLGATAAGGIVYFSTNYSRFELDAAAIHAQEIKDITKATTPLDFEGKLKRWCYRLLK